MRKYGAFEVAKDVGRLFETEVPESELVDVAEDRFGRVYTRAAAPAAVNLAPTGAPAGDADGRRAVGVRVDGKVLRGFPTPSRKLEFFSTTLAQLGLAESARCRATS